MNKNNNVIQFRNFGIAFGTNVIFENFDFDFTSGIYIFKGVSGVGKTTLMRCIAGLEKRYTGDIYLNGVRLCSTTPDIHMVHQHYTSFPWKNLVDNVLMVHKGHKVKITEEHIKQAKSMLKSFGLGDHMNKKPGQISGGQDQRLSLCSAFINPWSKVFLYDEPSSALDYENTQILSNLIETHQRIYNTIEIVISHDDELLKALNPKVIEFSEEFRLRPKKEVINKAERDGNADERK